IIPSCAFYDLDAKYVPGATGEICPARISERVSKEASDLAVRCHRALGCKGISRTDIIITPEGGMAVLETNTVPGMTPTSLVPQAAAAAGIGFGELMDIMIENAENETQ
ncbi:MAG: D-alanine--D-alanine ligase, partial [Abditibacteriota bacterium]|nr:D-alanine--D-alanine ligase [Abditibacteriota bacterium]